MLVAGEVVAREAGEQRHVASRRFSLVARWPSLDDGRPEALQFLDEGFLVATADVLHSQRMTLALAHRQPRRVVVEVRRWELELQLGVVKIERDAFAIVGERRHGEMHHVPQRLAAKQADRALSAGALGEEFGADYIANILRQQQSRRDVQPPLELKDPVLNQLATDPLSLAEYDAFILRSRKESCESTRTETESTQPDNDEPESGPDSE